MLSGVLIEPRSLSRTQKQVTSGHPRGLGVANAVLAVGVARKEWPPSPLGALTAD